MSFSAVTKGNGDDLRILILAPSGRDAQLAEQALARSGCQAKFAPISTSSAGKLIPAPGPFSSRRRRCRETKLRTRRSGSDPSRFGHHCRWWCSPGERSSPVWEPCAGWNAARR